MELNTLRKTSGSPGPRGGRDWPMTIVLGLALLLSGMPQEIAAVEWGD